MNDTPERITIYHDEEVGMLARQAESLTINEASINATCTQEIPGRTIDPVTEHVPGADPANNLAIFRAFRPDQPDPPPGNGSGGGGRGAPPPGPRGAGHGVPLPPHVDNNVMTPPMVGPTWLRVRSALGSDCLPVLSQGTASLCLDCGLTPYYLHCYRTHPMSRDWGCTSMSFPYLSMRP